MKAFLITKDKIQPFHSRLTMIQHSVIFTLKHTSDSIQAQNFWDAAKKLAEIPGVQNFECLKQTNPTNKFGYGLAMKFENQLLYDGYSNHPQHVEFIKKFWMNDVEDFLEIDYEEFGG